MNDRLVKIGIFYDGNWFAHVSRYYARSHPIHADISISGLHKWVQEYVAHAECVDIRRARIVNKHYFRGRFSAEEAYSLFEDRKFDDSLIDEGVSTQFLPIARGEREKGIDCLLVLETYKQAMYRKLDVCVLVAGDSDYVPLVRELNALGVEVMVLAWDLQYSIDQRHMVTRTSSWLLEEVTYPIMMDEEIQKLIDEDSPWVNDKPPYNKKLFTWRKEKRL